MDSQRQKTLAFIFCIIIFMLWKQEVLDPYMATHSGSAASPASQPGQGSLSAPSLPSPTATPALTAPDAQNAAPSDEDAVNAGTVTVHTNQLTAEFSLLGGRLTKLLLNEYKETLEKDSPSYNLVDHQKGDPFPLGIYVGMLDDSRVHYAVKAPTGSAGTIEVGGGSSSVLELSGVLADGREIQKKLRFSSGSFLVDVDVTVSGQPAPIALEWTKRVSSDPAAPIHRGEGRPSPPSFVWFDGQKAQQLVFAKLATPTQALGSIHWVSITEKYFLATLINDGGVSDGQALKSGELYASRLTGSNPGEAKFKLYAGPKSYRLLTSLGDELVRNINIEFGITGFVAAPLLLLLYRLEDVLGNFGLAIMALTILMKFVLLPVNSHLFKQTKAMQELQPEIKRIRDTIQDKQQQQLATMNLYRERKVNPFGGCFPVLLQMPIFIGLLSALNAAVELRHAPFALWIKDLSAPERFMIGGVGLPVMVILFVISMWVQQLMNPASADPAQKKMMMIMPIVFGVMFANFPAGLTLYWLTNNVISIGQQKGLYKGGHKSAIAVTAIVAASIFAFAFVLTHLPS